MTQEKFITLYPYFCGECKKPTYIEKIKLSENVHCAHCGTSGIDMCQQTYEKFIEQGIDEGGAE
ncbi:hypothetical protein [Bacillus sp. FSL P4-0248]|uniref:hypothetical protein n=1 Tax=Bacillus sp. FSL P4-0248 TaxID=2954582 RepID=UPI0031589C88